MPGHWRPIITMRPTWWKGEPATAAMGLLICDDHKKATAVPDLISDEGWAQIVASFDAIKRTRPDREATGLRWHYVTPASWAASRNPDRVDVAGDSTYPAGMDVPE
jgi:hypothetical protein